jgi:hypothetical protein
MTLLTKLSWPVVCVTINMIQAVTEGTKIFDRGLQNLNKQYFEMVFISLNSLTPFQNCSHTEPDKYH